MKPPVLRAATLLALLGVAALCHSAAAEETDYRQAKAFSAKVPAEWMVQDHWNSPAPSVGFLSLEGEGEYRILVSKYAKDNPFRITRRKYVADLEKRMPAGGKVDAKAGARTVTLFRGINIASSPYAAPHFDPHEAVLGPSGGDYSEKGRLLRCRERGAWRKYDWYRQAYEKRASLELFFKYFKDEDKRLLETCLGKAAVGGIERREQPDASIQEPDDARIDVLAAALTPAPEGPPEETVSLVDVKDGFFVVRYESPRGKQDRHYPVYLRFLATFKPE